MTGNQFDEQALLETTVDGHFVNSKWRHLAEILADLYPSLELRWSPPNKRNEHTIPYMLVAKDKLGKPYIAMLLAEDDRIEDILEKIFNAHVKNGDVLSRMKARNFAHQLAHMKKMEDQIAYQNDVAAFLVSTKKVNPMIKDVHTGETVKFDSQLNRVAHRKHYGPK